MQRQGALFLVSSKGNVNFDCPAMWAQSYGACKEYLEIVGTPNAGKRLPKKKKEETTQTADVMASVQQAQQKISGVISGYRAPTLPDVKKNALAFVAALSKKPVAAPAPGVARPIFVP
ncbi:MAG: hypothetical protein M1823_006336 [Watsoniomyces obsoletus]|nr:MAG: hypothetical protein M1823_006336 [Watsoniomyces obsoletus]